MKSQSIFAILFLALAIHPRAEAQVERSPGAIAANPLSAACNGTWGEVMDARYSLQKLKGIETPAVQQKATCLLHAIDVTTFDARDPQWDAFLAAEDVRFLVGAFGQSGYDFFATQIPLHHERVRAALAGVLFQHGQPDAVALYFGERREQLTRGAQIGEQARAIPSRYRPLLEKGECPEPLCSSRMPETLRVVGENLDIVQKDLEGTTTLKPRAGASDQEVKDLEKRRADARDLLEVVGRLRRGEATIGKVR
jgi:hypothetical protein